MNTFMWIHQGGIQTDYCLAQPGLDRWNSRMMIRSLSIMCTTVISSGSKYVVMSGEYDQ